MPGHIRVAPEDLHTSAGTVDTHAEELHARHIAANGRIAAAHKGVPTNAAVALNVAVTRWEAETTALHGHLVAHSGALRGAAQEYVSTEENNAATVQSVENGVDLGP